MMSDNKKRKKRSNSSVGAIPPISQQKQPEEKQEMLLFYNSFNDMQDVKKKLKDNEGNASPAQSPKNSPPSSPIKAKASSSSYNSPMRNHLSKLLESSSFSSPPRATKPTVESVIKQTPNGEDLFHIMSTVPGKEFIEAHKSLVLETPKLAGDILNAIATSRGVYYAAIWRDFTKQSLSALHLAHTVLHEKITGELVKNKSHNKKAKDINLGIDNLISEIEKITEWGDGLKLKPGTLKLLDNFKEYLNLHAKLLSVAICYASNDVKVITKNTPVIEKLSKLVKKWHTGDVQENISALKDYAGCAKPQVQEQTQDKEEEDNYLGCSLAPSP